MLLWSLTLLSNDLCPTVNWTNGLGSLVTFLPDCRRRKNRFLQTRESDGEQNYKCILEVKSQESILKQKRCTYKDLALDLASFSCYVKS